MSLLWEINKMEMEMEAETLKNALHESKRQAVRETINTVEKEMLREIEELERQSLDKEQV